MFATRFALVCVLGLMACRDELVPISDAGGGGDGMKCAALPDLLPPAPKCAAAKGLSGNNLLCVDFSSISDQMLGNQLPQQLQGWSFNNPQNCWEVASGILQITNFGQFHSTCGFTLPQYDVTQPQYSQYNNITLSVVQKVDLDLGTTFPNQLAQVYNTTAIPAFLLAQTSGTLPQQQAILTIDKQNLPGPTANLAQYLLQVESGTAVSNKQGLQISSIAVNLSQ